MSPKIAALAVPAAAVQLGGYGCGFLKAWWTKIVLRKGYENCRKGMHWLQ